MGSALSTYVHNCRHRLNVNRLILEVEVSDLFADFSSPLLCRFYGAFMQTILPQKHNPTPLVKSKQIHFCFFIVLQFVSACRHIRVQSGAEVLFLTTGRLTPPRRAKTDLPTTQDSYLRHLLGATKIYPGTNNAQCKTKQENKKKLTRERILKVNPTPVTRQAARR